MHVCFARCATQGRISYDGGLVRRDIDARLLNAVYWNSSFNLVMKLATKGCEGVGADVFASGNFDEFEELELCC